MIDYYAGEYREVAELFSRSVHEMASQMYSDDQVNAWAPVPVNYAWWQARCELKRPFLFRQARMIAGFMEFDNDGHIDCHYTHPEFTRKGVAGMLLSHIVSIAEALSMPRLYVEASHLIKPLYVKHGFQCLRLNHVAKGSVTIENWIMERNFTQQGGALATFGSGDL